MVEVVVITGAIRRAKLQSNHHHQQTNIQFSLQAGCPSCRPNNSVKALKVNFGPVCTIKSFLHSQHGRHRLHSCILGLFLYSRFLLYNTRNAAIASLVPQLWGWKILVGTGMDMK